MKSVYRTFGPHIVSKPPELDFTPNPGKTLPPAVTPVDEIINRRISMGWEFVTLIDGFPIQIPQTTLGLNGRPQVIALTGVCVLMRRVKA